MNYRYLRIFFGTFAMVLTILIEPWMSNQFGFPEASRVFVKMITYVLIAGFFLVLINRLQRRASKETGES